MKCASGKLAMEKIRAAFSVMQLCKGTMTKCSDDTVLVESEWSQRNAVSQKMLRSSSVQQCDLGAASATAPHFTPLAENMALSATSDSGVRVCLVQEEAEESKDHLLVIAPGRAPHVIGLNATKLHGKVYTDVEFGGLAVSPSGSKVAFVAEAYKPKGRTVLCPSEAKDDKEKEVSYKFEWQPDWGEQMTGQSKPVLVVIPCDSEDGDEGRVMVEAGEGVAGLGELCWVGEDEVVGVARKETSPRLGAIYCRNRESWLFGMKLTEKTITPLIPSSAPHWIGSPRISPDSKFLVYLQGPVGGPHINAAQLIKLTLSSKETRILVDYTPPHTEGLDYSPALCLTGATLLPTRPFLSPNVLLLTTLVGVNYKPLAVCTDSGHVECVVAPATSPSVVWKSPSVVVRDVLPGVVLFSTSSVLQPDALWCARLRWDADAERPETLALRNVTGVVTTRYDAPPLAREEWWPLAKEEGRDYSVPVLYAGPVETGGSPRPLVVLLHGGPHSAVANSHTLTTSLFLSAGYSVVAPNYAGSLGVGKAGIEALPGRAGSLDVQHCHRAVVECLERYAGVLDPNNVFLYGGSHGGFLVHHLASYAPGFYRAIASINPVTDIAAMAAQTDIPDWCFVEAVGAAAGDGCFAAPKADQLKSMLECSPIAGIECVVTPTLLFLGSKDRRVPMSQGMKYHQLLRHKGVPTRLFVYPDCHSLGKVLHTAEEFAHTLDWFAEHAA